MNDKVHKKRGKYAKVIKITTRGLINAGDGTRIKEFEFERYPLNEKNSILAGHVSTSNCDDWTYLEFDDNPVLDLFQYLRMDLTHDNNMYYFDSGIINESVCCEVDNVEISKKTYNALKSEISAMSNPNREVNMPKLINILRQINDVKMIDWILAWDEFVAPLLPEAQLIPTSQNTKGKTQILHR